MEILLIFIAAFATIYLIKNKRNNPENAELFANALADIVKFNEDVEFYKNDYFTYQNKKTLIYRYQETYNFFHNKKYKRTKDLRIIEFLNTYSNISSLIQEWNEEYIKKELYKNKTLLDNIDGKSLDDQQRRAVVVDEINNLVLAGAGSGKTLTISGKVKYLVDVKNIKPEEILLISFTKKAAEEMSIRIANKLNINIESKTFHKLGLDIITKHNKKRFDVAESLNSVVDEYFEKQIFEDDNQIINMINFFSYYMNIPKNMEDYKSLGELYEEEKSVDFETLKGKYNRDEIVNEKVNSLKTIKKTIQGETVRSLEEVQIANFLFLNCVNYEYESLYPFESDDPYRKSYRPDFYLPDYNIYIEHFGISKDERVPWLSEIEETKYLEGIKWKREFHKKNGTRLLETYSYYNSDGRLVKELEIMLKENNVKFKEADYLGIYNKIYESASDKYFKEFKKLVSSFIGLFKSNGYNENSFEDLIKKSQNIKNSFLKQRSLTFIDIVKPIYILYQIRLKESESIDFNDMINLATEIIKDGNLDLYYKYIIIDEYQDISVSRYNLIKAIKIRTNAKLMCVGDDWQSIYRFAGSDIDLFTNFDKYFGFYKLLKIEKTYRNSQELIDIAGEFVMSNPNQLKKSLKSDKHNTTPIVIKGYSTDIISAVRSSIDDIVLKSGDASEVIILGRNNFDIEFIEESSNYEFKILRSSGLIKYKKYPRLQIKFLTAHRSKGLEADNVIIINLENKLVGFPNKISDDPVLSLVLTNKDDFSCSEERRLFYVGLTRTKNSTYLIVPDRNPSIFIDEIKKAVNVLKYFNSNERTIQDNPNCPKCKKGVLVIRENLQNKSKFLGCSNYPMCDYATKYDVLSDKKICNKCGGFMIKRKGQFGDFYGCSNYPHCKNTEKINTGYL
jgi:DNA helicase-4